MRAISLDDDAALDASIVGVKAARLATSRRHGMRVPEGWVLSTSMCGAEFAAAREEAVNTLVACLGDVPVAVRSSAVAEDAVDASYAGMYLSLLNVGGLAAIRVAVEQVIESAGSQRVRAYDGSAADGAIAVLIQTMVIADAAGVAFSADPLSGERNAALVLAVAGLGETLVAGEATGERWRVVGQSVEPPANPGVLGPDDAQAIADLAQAAERIFGCPQDIEWAIENREVHLLQTRPMTALPDEVSWNPPNGGYYRSDFRIGEWLSAPITPLFATWFLPLHEDGLNKAFEGFLGMTYRRPMNVIVNGWYFVGFAIAPRSFFRMWRRRTLRYFAAFSRVERDLHRAEPHVAAAPHAYYRDRIAPELERNTADATERLDTASPAELIRIVERLSAGSGKRFFAVATVLGFAWKAELALRRFCESQLAEVMSAEPAVLLAGLTAPTAPATHSVVSLDWSEPTLGELALDRGPLPTARFAELQATRQEVEQRCRAALSGDLHETRRFEQTLEVAQRYARIREEMAAELTVDWPLLRRALTRLGAIALQVGAIEASDDIHLLTRDELLAAVEGATVSRRQVVEERRVLRATQSGLRPPASIGEMTRLWKPVVAMMQRLSETPRGTHQTQDPSQGESTAIVGVSASPGSAVGSVRLVRGPEDFEFVKAGDILVAPTTAPAWTALFGMVAAVVTDGGSLAAHASLIAREYGIPAVVATGDATQRLRTGTVVHVDGHKGEVRILREHWAT